MEPRFGNGSPFMAWFANCGSAGPIAYPVESE
jgi:hypothetical protein